MPNEPARGVLRAGARGERSAELHPRTAPPAYTLLETVVILAVMSLLFTLVSVTFFGRLAQKRLDADVAEFARNLRLAAEHAVLKGETYAVVIDVYDGRYAVYPTDESGENLLEERPLLEPRLLQRCWIDEVEFEDGSTQYSGQIIIRATPQGWSGSVLMHLADKDDRQRDLRLDKLTTNVVLARERLQLLEPQRNLSLHTPL